MKKMLIAVFCVLIAVFVLMTGFSFYGRTERQKELDNAMQAAMEKSMQILLSEDNPPKTDKEWESVFVNALAYEIDSNSQLKVVCKVVDIENGILSAEAILTYKHANGNIGHVSCEETIFLEEYLKE